MQEKVVYLIGAGFSAPLGLPTMSNFIRKSRALLNENRKRYQHFERVLKMTDLAIAKDYFNTDLGNIEEILSILDMRAQLEDDPHLSKAARKYIIDVIKRYTPEIKPFQERPLPQQGDWGDFIFGTDLRWFGYGVFAASLHNLTIERYTRDKKALRWHRIPNPETRYDVISLNYDLVLEKPCEHLNSQCEGEYPLRFQRTESDTSATELGLPWLVKLHGSVDRPPEDIIAPTWSKALTNSIKEQWRVAHRLLVEANHVRALGYSLPTSDTYVKHLIISAFVQAEHEKLPGLQSFDVITLDDRDGTSQDRYKQFVPSCRFANAKIEDYFTFIESTELGQRPRPKIGDKIQFTNLEEAHQAFMDKYTG